MDQNETEKQTIEIQPEPGRRPRRRIAAIVILCLVLLAGFGVFTSRLGQVPSDGNGHISSRVLSEKQWSRIFTENGEHRITHVYDFASTYGRLSSSSVNINREKCGLILLLALWTGMKIRNTGKDRSLSC